MEFGHKTAREGEARRRSPFPSLLPCAPLVLLACPISPFPSLLNAFPTGYLILAKNISIISKINLLQCQE